jgi:hypothetical protein
MEKMMTEKKEEGHIVMFKGLRLNMYDNQLYDPQAEQTTKGKNRGKIRFNWGAKFIMSPKDSAEGKAQLVAAKMAEAKAKEDATLGLSEAQVMHAKADANERQGIVDAIVVEKMALAEAAGMTAKATSSRDLGFAEAEVIREKAIAEASGIEEKANAMKKLDGVGKEHEEFKLRLNKELQVDLAHINIQKDIADAQASVIGEALKAAKIDIVGGETMFFDQIVGQITRAKGFDRLVNSSENITEIKKPFIT